jgi:hypothetical protein
LQPRRNLTAAQAADKLPAAIGGPALRAAAAAGNPAAEYEIGVRYSEGRGVTANLELAAQWFDRAAQQGLAPALYRLGSLHEKGQGVKKDLNKARQLYLVAADKGNAKAIHNLAVLYAEGIDGKPDYNTAAQWFRKAALRGVADSQYNLGILYARGIGVDQNPRRILQMVRACGPAGRPGRGQEARRCRGAARPAVARGGAPRGADLRGRAACRRGHGGQGARRRLGSRNPAAPVKPAVTTRRKPQSS